MALQKNQAELFVTRLAEKTFLRFWSFPNVYRMEGGRPKEICDLLIVSGDSILILSVKFARFSFESPLALAWSRWYRRAIAKSARQLFGAEAYLKSCAGGVFLDNECSEALPVPLPTTRYRRVYRILVALGIAGACRRAIPERGGSLILCPKIEDSEHLHYPFQIGNVWSDREFVHVFDDVSFEHVLRELDTITDFTEYLAERKTLLLSGRVARCDGEENLLAGYLRNRAGEGDKFGLPDTKQKIHIVDGGWQRVESDPRFVARKNADRRSYWWDELINKIWASAGNEDSASDATASSTEAERIARHMAAERRFARRQICSSIAEFVKNAPPDRISRRAMRIDLCGRRCYVLVVMPRADMSDGEYRGRRRALLRDYAFAAAYEYRKTHDVVIGIAMEHPNSGKESYDANLTEVLEWTSEFVEEAKELKSRRGFFRPDATEFSGRDEEYPQIRVVCHGSQHSIKVRRNAPCPCGSGRKFKRCCGAARDCQEGMAR
jgi:hypothetical protein